MSILDNLTSLSPQSLTTVLTAAIDILSGESGVEEGLDAGARELPPSRAARLIAPKISKIDSSVNEADILSALTDPKISRELAIFVIDELCSDPVFKGDLLQELEVRSRVMAGPETLMMVGALVILAMRIKDVKWSPDAVAIRFDTAQSAVKGFVSGLISIIKQ